MLTLLMFRGANVNSVDKKDRRPIHYAAFMGKTHTAQKMFSIKDFFGNCDHICSKLRTWSHLLKKILMENLNFFCSVIKSTLIFLHKRIRACFFDIIWHFYYRSG